MSTPTAGALVWYFSPEHGTHIQSTVSHLQGERVYVFSPYGTRRIPHGQCFHTKPHA